MADLAASLKALNDKLKEIVAAGTGQQLAKDNGDPVLDELVLQINDLLAGMDEFHTSSMDLALGLGEIHMLLQEVRTGNFLVKASEELLSSPNEVIAGLGSAFNDTVAEFREQVETIQRQQYAIQELSTPILEVWDGVLALPVIGVVDTRRSVEIMERLLAAIVNKRARFVIIDITGVEVVDTRTADQFIKVIKAAELLGAKCVLTGIQPSVAQTLVEIGVDLSSITTLRNLHAGLQECLQQLEELEADFAGLHGEAALRGGRQFNE